LSNVHIKELENKTYIQDTIITTLKLKEQNYITLVEQERRKTLIYQDELKLAQKEIKKLKAKRTFGRIIYGVIIGGLTYLYITK
jgi:IS30 family transposase